MSGSDESWATGAFTSCPTLDALEELCSLRRTLENTRLVSQEAVLRAHEH